MSYAGGTTHYNFPQIVSSDRPTFADFNEAFRTLDTKIYGLEGDSTTTDGRLDTLEDKMGTAESDIVNLKAADIRIEGKADANAEAITLLQGTVGQHTTAIAAKADMVAIADEYSSERGYTIGDVVMYNGQRYVCSTTYTTGEPFDADKWTGEDVETVLESHASSIAQISTDLSKIRITSRIKQATIDVNNADFYLTARSSNDVDIFSLIAYDTDTLAYVHSADGGQTYQTVWDINTGKTLGQAVDVSSYTSSGNQYTCPGDGYISFNAGGEVGSEGSLIVEGHGLAQSFTAIQGDPNIQSVFVKKGFHIYFSVLSGTGAAATFIPVT